LAFTENQCKNIQKLNKNSFMMKIKCILLALFLLQFSLTDLRSQSIQNNHFGFTNKYDKSPLFGFDTFINNQPLQNQRNVVLCSAFNGWLYAAYAYFDNSAHEDAVIIACSKNDGISWSVILNGTTDIFHSEVKKLDILACGHDTINLKVFAGYCIFDSANSTQSVSIVRYDKNGNYEDEILHSTSPVIRDFALASDNLYPATNSNPFSLGLVYSKGTLVFGDSIVFCSSSNGGISFDSHYNIASSSYYFHKVALAYGRSSSYNNGRYFASWEEQDNVNSVSGHIYTAHSEPNFNSPFPTPVLLDSLDPSSTNEASNPVIACQNNADDNDSSNLTEVILYEKYQPAVQKYNIAGFYNKKSTNSDNFKYFTIDSTTDNKLQPSICFNAFDSTFIVTDFDSTIQELPYYIHNLNMTDPNTWIELSARYNDYNNLVAPNPKVAMDFGKQMGANVWIGERGNGNEAAMFDSPFTYYTGISEKNQDVNKLVIKIFPNPASDYVNIEFDLQQSENVSINIHDPLGQLFTNIDYPSCTSGKHLVKLNITNYKAGIYILTVQTEHSYSSDKLLVSK
jgi:hypothetical protein